MKKFLVAFLTILLCFCVAVALFGCNNTENKTDDPTDSGEPTVPVEPPLPTASEIVAARNNAVSEAVRGYDFNLTFTGDFSVLGLGTTLTGKYDGAYRYDGNSDEVTFKRTTSGALLPNSTCYVFTSGDSRIKATMDGNTVKKLSVEAQEEQNITMVNLPVVAIVDAAKVENISEIVRTKNSVYEYSCQLSLGNSNPVFTVLGKVLEKLSTGVSFKDIELAGNASKFDFDIKDGKLDDFHLGFKMQINVKAVNVVINFDYTQNGTQTEITLPNTANSGLIYDKNDIRTEINAINSAISDLKDDPVYSLDLTAKNEFDPGWNKNAIVDSYTARMYKNTIDDIDWFNHSYFYKAHSETAGKETYKYTLGNVNGENAENQGTWLISRKSTNTQTKVQNVTAATQFEFLTDMVKQNAEEIDCIKKQTSGTTSTYTLFLGKAATQRLQKKIIDMINTNDYDEVIKVDNYFNEENEIKDASIKIIVKNGKLSSVVCDTELCYTPIGGEYIEYNITLNNLIELKVNENLDKAQKYTPPTKVKGTLGIGKNLNDSQYYIV